MAEVQIRSLSHRHQEIADWLFAHPQVKNLQHLCNEMNITRPWLSVVMRSDVFQEYFQRRRREYEQDLQGRLALRQLDISLKALDKLEDILASDEVDDRLVLDIAQKTAENCGFGPSRHRTTVIKEQTQEITRSVDAGTLAQARETIRLITRTENAPAPESD